MARPSRPEVNDPSLRATLERVGDHIENYTANLDAISTDIKRIEEYLTASGIRLPVTIRISSYSEIDADHGGSERSEEQQISWRPGVDGDQRWRVMYARVIAYYEPGDEYGRLLEGPEQVETKPLIESPVQVRLLAYRFLPQLVAAVGKLVEVGPFGPGELTDDIPF